MARATKRRFKKPPHSPSTPPSTEPLATPSPAALATTTETARNGFAFIMPCMGRLDHAQQSLPKLMACAAIDGVHNFLVFVDYHCPQQSGKWVHDAFGERVNVIAVGKHVSIPTGKVPAFNKPMALNTGALQAIELGAQYLVFIDADTLVTPLLLEYLFHNASIGQFMIFEPNDHCKDLTGFLVVHRRHFVKVNGYHNSFKGWGAEDLDMRVRLFLHGKAPAGDLKVVLRDISQTLPWAEIPPELASAIPHEDARRVAHYSEKDTDISHGVNLNLLCSNVYNKLGVHPTELHETPLGPSIRRLLGMELLVNPRSTE